MGHKKCMVRKMGHESKKFKTTALIYAWKKLLYYSQLKSSINSNFIWVIGKYKKKLLLSKLSQYTVINNSN
jgi:hypothetical protein